MVHSRLASFDFPGPLDGPHAIPSAQRIRSSIDASFHYIHRHLSGVAGRSAPSAVHVTLTARSARADTAFMLTTAEDHLTKAIWGQPTITHDRRKAPSRRTSWRGGRRDSDWLSRPPGALKRFEKLQPRTARLRRFVMSFLWIG